MFQKATSQGGNDCHITPHGSREFRDNVEIIVFFMVVIDEVSFKYKKENNHTELKSEQEIEVGLKAIFHLRRIFKFLEL